MLAYVRQLGEEAILCVANISRSAQAVELDMRQWKGRVPQEMLGRTRFPRIGELPYLVTLPPYGFFWFSLEQEAESEPEKVLPREITTLVLGPGWEAMLLGLDPAHARARRAAGLHARPALVRRQGLLGRSPAPSAAIPIEHGNDHFVAAIADVTGGTAPAAISCR